MDDPKTWIPQASTSPSLKEVKASFAALEHSGAVRSVLRSGLSLSELADPAVQRALVDATMLDSMLNAVTVTKGGDEVVDYKERRTAAVALAKMKGYDSGESKRKRVLEEVENFKRFVAAKEIVVEKE